MKNPLVSVILPVYGVEDYIAKCIDSILNQSYVNTEIIFVNDCTKDNSINIIKEKIDKNNADRIKVLEHETNRGLSAARNTGVKAAKGDYILHVDSDDWIEPSMIEKMVIEAEKSNADIVICGVNIKTPKGIKINLPQHYDDKDEFIRNILYKNVPGSMWGKLISKKIYDEHVDAWSIEGINHGEDYATMPRILSYANRLSYVDEPLYDYNMLNVNSYTNNFSEKSMSSMIKADSILESFFKEKYGEAVIGKMLLRSKAGMIKRCNHNLYPQLSKLYLDTQKKYIGDLSFYDALILRSVNKGFDHILSKLIKWSNKIRQ